MRVLMLSSNWPPGAAGGAEAYVERLRSELIARGHEVGAVTLGVPGDDVVATVPARPHRLDRHVSGSRPAKLRFHAADLHRRDVAPLIADAVRRFRPDVVHSHVVAGMSVRSLKVPAALGVPHVHTLHDHWLRCWRSTGTSRRQRRCGPACRGVERLRLRSLRDGGPDTVIAISRAVRDAHAALGADRLRVLHHPADIAPRRRPGGARRPPVFGYLGRLDPNKGIPVLLAAARLRTGGRGRWVIAGDGRLAAQVAAAQGDGLEYRGWVAGDAKEAFFDDIDCLVVPSVWAEPAGLVVREAAARGVPVIASDIGGLPEYVPSSCRELLFPAGDVPALLDRLDRFATRPTAYEVDPDEIPSWADHVAALLDLYTARRAGIAA